MTNANQTIEKTSTHLHSGILQTQILANSVTHTIQAAKAGVRATASARRNNGRQAIQHDDGVEEEEEEEEEEDGDDGGSEAAANAETQDDVVAAPRPLLRLFAAGMAPATAIKIRF